MAKINMKIVSNKKIYSLLLFGAFLVPSSVFASTVYIDTTHSEFFVGDTVLLSVRLDSEGKAINTVEGEVVLDHAVDTASLIDINTSGSEFTLWPGRPLPSERNTRVTFAGGSPGGLTSSDAVVFNIVLKLEEPGKVAVSPSDIGVYVHDGQGTKDVVNVRSLVIDILPKEPDAETTDDWSTIVLNDKTPPEPFEIYVGQEDSVFDGKKFLSFTTTDTGSGISHYEVIEENFPPVRSNDTYVLQEQNNPVRVTVTAFDSAGNARESVYTCRYSSAAPHITSPHSRIRR
jgi:hypothetical protein